MNNLDDLLAQRALMLEYLHLKLELDDMHGVMDAAADIREIDVRIEERKNAS